MSVTEVVVEGTLKSDGTLELDQKPNLSPGRVTVALRQESAPSATAEGWWPLMQRLRAEREAAGHPFMDESEMDAHVRWLRDDDERIDRIHREIELEKRKGAQP
jgi:hypothetical protein